ncbi:cbb3-type cytochrome oxidase assembly protein CcoS [Zavarzinella formosa]|uniref:cbb3-type cytochrome oxidase assembly protein CcoS n=1 Tax=Zavarzinella formosa TaxID=360055 RepID=UPI0003126E9C|nr:cbb3-type cytochrome oxidase assembly protein CcoS [Zavarzinella formosa]
MVPAELMVRATLLFSVIAFGGAAALVLAWAVQNGQFDNFTRAAEGIFDADEPIGQPTDRTLSAAAGERDA